MAGGCDGRIWPRGVIFLSQDPEHEKNNEIRKIFNKMWVRSFLFLVSYQRAITAFYTPTLLPTYSAEAGRRGGESKTGGEHLSLLPEMGSHQ